MTYGPEHGKRLALELGNKLAENDSTLDEALTCFIVSTNFESALAVWDKKLKAELRHKHHSEQAKLLQDVFEKVNMLKMVTKNHDTNPTFDVFFTYFRLTIVEAMEFF